VFGWKNVKFEEPYFNETSKELEAERKMTLKLEGDELCKLFRVKFPKYSDIEIKPAHLNPLLESVGVVSLHEYEIMEAGNEKNPSLINLQYCLQTRDAVTINSNNIGIVLRRQYLDSGVEAPRSLEVEVTGINKIHTRSSRTKNFVDVCKHYMTEGILAGDRHPAQTGGCHHVRDRHHHLGKSARVWTTRSRLHQGRLR
jgi:hypothetical protein